MKTMIFHLSIFKNYVLENINGQHISCIKIKEKNQSIYLILTFTLLYLQHWFTNMLLYIKKVILPGKYNLGKITD